MQGSADVPEYCKGPEASAIGSAYTDEERDFLRGIERLQRAFGLKYPNCRDVLAFARLLGYRKVAEPRPPARFHRRGV